VYKVLQKFDLRLTNSVVAEGGMVTMRGVVGVWWGSGIRKNTPKTPFSRENWGKTYAEALAKP